MLANNIHFSCVGCGACCKGRLIPLTLAEAQQWLNRGHEVAVILEAFNESNGSLSPQQFDHAVGRSSAVRCGEARIQLIAVFAGKALEQCPNLTADNLCGIYDERPLVCSIYPMEINPFIPLVRETKACPPESWESDQIICTDGRAEPSLEALIQLSRQADKLDASSKVAICADLGLRVASWKGNALAVYFPQPAALLDAISNVGVNAEKGPDIEWQVRADDPSLHDSLVAANLALASSESTDYIFHRL